jgi:hypothetical protein
MPPEILRAGGVEELERAVEQLTRQLCEAHRREAATAVENLRLFEAEQALRRELAEALAWQTATSEVLGVIASSPTVVQPVFDTIARSAALLCEATLMSWCCASTETCCASLHIMDQCPPVILPFTAGRWAVAR